jgi:L-alanine-DL-glutamate epimerase-like enolase superfamily enzyme
VTLLTLAAREEAWPIRGSFRISRGAKTEARVVVAEVSDGGRSGRGECVPYARYGESVESVLAQIDSVRGVLTDRAALQAQLPAGAARNAVDCALWDLEAKRAGRRAWELAGLPQPQPQVTAYTLSLDEPAAMAEAARAASDRPLLKLMLGGEGDVGRVAAVRAAAPRARLIVDANEAWRPEQVEPFGRALAALGVELIEQPLPAGDDGALAGVARPVPICADESCHDRAGLKALVGRYDCVNVKLDKTGGLTEALALVAEAERLGLALMVGCMVGTSLAMAPATLAAAGAAFVDLDGPLLLARDREPALSYEGGMVRPPAAILWG